jgi:hypothetical protein
MIIIVNFGSFQAILLMCIVRTESVIRIPIKTQWHSKRMVKLEHCRCGRLEIGTYDYHHTSNACDKNYLWILTPTYKVKTEYVGGLFTNVMSKSASMRVRAYLFVNDSCHECLQ